MCSYIKTLSFSLSRYIRSGGFKKSTILFDWLISGHPDSIPGDSQVHFKCFRDTNATAKSVSANSKPKNLDMQIYADCSKINKPKIAELNPVAF